MSRVMVVPWDKRWKSDFECIRDELQQALGDTIVCIEHVGSTSVQGLAAKPCIDIDIVIEGYAVFPAVAVLLKSLGYTHEGDLGIKDREAFAYEGKKHLLAHHLYVCPEGSRELKRHIAFRDHLRRDRGAVEMYSRIKEEAVQLYPEEMEKYIAHKGPAIEELYARFGIDQLPDEKKVPPE